MRRGYPAGNPRELPRRDPPLPGALATECPDELPLEVIRCTEGRADIYGRVRRYFSVQSIVCINKPTLYKAFTRRGKAYKIFATTEGFRFSDWVHSGRTSCLVSTHR